jgi:hypothetical protein
MIIEEETKYDANARNRSFIVVINNPDVHYPESTAEEVFNRCKTVKGL